MYKAIAATILGLALLVGPVFGETITPEQPNSAYVPLVRAELLFMSDVADDWKKADTLFAEGLEALERESVEARWFQSSARQVVKLLAEQGRRTPPPPWVKDAMKFLGRLQGGSADN